MFHKFNKEFEAACVIINFTIQENTIVPIMTSVNQIVAFDVLLYSYRNNKLTFPLIKLKKKGNVIV